MVHGHCLVVPLMFIKKGLKNNFLFSHFLFNLRDILHKYKHLWKIQNYPVYKSIPRTVLSNAFAQTLNVTSNCFFIPITCMPRLEIVQVVNWRNSCQNLTLYHHKRSSQIFLLTSCFMIFYLTFLLLPWKGKITNCTFCTFNLILVNC